MAGPEQFPLWKRWWVWCAACLLLGAILFSQQRVLRDPTQQSAAAVEAGLAPTPSPLKAPEAEFDPPPTSGDSQVDASLRDEIRRWQSEFRFSQDVREKIARRAIQVFAPFLLFHGGRTALPDSLREAHAEAARLRSDGAQAGMAADVSHGAELIKVLETAAADWLQVRTLESVDTEVPSGGWVRRSPERLRVTHGNIVSGLGHVVWAGPSDFPTAFNARIAAAILEWVDEFKLPQEEIPSLARAILTRLLVLQPGPGGDPPDRMARMRACEEGMQWMHAARDEARPLFARTGWVNIPRLLRQSTEAAARRAELSASGDVGPADARAIPASAANTPLPVLQAGYTARGLPRDGRLQAPFEENVAHSAQRLAALAANTPAELTNSISIQMVLIPAGEFQMGSTAGQLLAVRGLDPGFKKEWERAESPSHRVRLSRPFYLARHEVTRAQFAAFVQATGYRTDSQRDGKGGIGFEEQGGEAKQGPQYDWQNPGFRQQENEPVVNVSWNDAIAFCNWLSQKEGRIYRLPTEAEWEYACRGGTANLFCGDDDPLKLVTVANIADATAHARFGKWKTVAGRDGYAFTAPVGTFRANPFGLHDMIGNVWEWCSDWYSADYYSKSAEIDPAGPAKGSVRVMRGGSWYDAATFNRCAFRYWDLPTYRDYFVGFRVAADATPH